MLLQRLITGLALAILVLAVAFLLPPKAISALIVLVVLLGAWEWGGFLGANSYAARLGYVAVIAVALALAWWFSQTPEVYRGLLWGSLAWWAIAFIWILRFPTPVPRAAVFLCGIAVLVPFGIGLLGLSHEAANVQWIIYALVVTISADVGGYFVGRAIGRARLAPSVSPGKTWEGLGGGVALALLVTTAAAYWFDVPWVPFAALSVAMALVSVVGDLTVSMFKRHAGLKDSGQLLPGHGGLLDRIDSLSASIPLFALGLSWLLAQ